MNRWIAVCGLALTVLTSAVALKSTVLTSRGMSVGVITVPPQFPVITVPPQLP